MASKSHVACQAASDNVLPWEWDTLYNELTAVARRSLPAESVEVARSAAILELTKSLSTPATCFLLSGKPASALLMWKLWTCPAISQSPEHTVPLILPFSPSAHA